MPAAIICVVGSAMVAVGAAQHSWWLVAFWIVGGAAMATIAQADG